MRYLLTLLVIHFWVIGFTLAPYPAQAQILPPELADAKKLLDTLKGFSDIKTGQQGANAAASLADQLRDIDIPKAAKQLSDFIPANTGDDLTKIGQLLGALQQGSYWRGINDAYDELSKRYNLPNLPRTEKDDIYRQLQKLRDLLSSASAITDALNKLKDELLNNLKNAGYDLAEKTLKDLIDGKIKPKDAGDIFKKTDLDKLKDVYRKSSACNQTPIENVVGRMMGNGSLIGNPRVSLCK